MEDKTTITAGNETIARFMGHEEGYDEHGVWQKLRYHEDWRDLMPVVENITRHVYDEEEVDDGFGVKRIAKYTAYLRTFGMLSSEGKQMVRFNRSALFEADTLIEATYQAVVDWIRGYNTQSKP